MRPPARFYARDEIVGAGRWAWASSKGDDQLDLYYDGHRFWRWSEGRARCPAAADALPSEGWRHAQDCLCELCRPREEWVPLKPRWRAERVPGLVAR